MFRKLYNLARFTAELEPAGPVLVVEGGLSPDPVAPKLAFVRTVHGGEPTVYLPGSSLKGVLRAHCERLLATTLSPAAAEDPFTNEDAQAPRRARAKEARKDGDGAAVYRASCPADRLFGSTELAGRCRIVDAYPTPATRERANLTEVRFGVAISRQDQSVAHGPFDQEAVTGGRFRLQITLENFELWMIVLLLQGLRDLHQGLIQVGHAKSRGFGWMTVQEPRLSFQYPGRPPRGLEGAGAREPDAAVRELYGLDAEDKVKGKVKVTPVGLMSECAWAGWEKLQKLEELLQVPWQLLVSQEAGPGEEAGHGA